MSRLAANDKEFTSQPKKYSYALLRSSEKLMIFTWAHSNKMSKKNVCFQNLYSRKYNNFSVKNNDYVPIFVSTPFYIIKKENYRLPSLFKIITQHFSICKVTNLISNLVLFIYKKCKMCQSKHVF